MRPPPFPPPGAASLHTRLSLMLTLVLALALLAGGALWLRETRNAIHEEIESAGRVAEQWLTVLIDETRLDGADGQARLMSALAAVGRIRAHALEITATGGQRLYASPGATYKAGRTAPAWFAGHLAPHLRVRHFDAGPVQISLLPDASRAVLDAWDGLTSLAGWALAGLLLAGIGCHLGLRKALAPLRAIDTAFDRGARGHFDQRLPAVGAPELDRLARSYNRLADQLDHTLADNAALAADRHFARAVQDRLEAERRLIARELHDELSQGITAVRAIAGAIQQRSTEQPGIHGNAQVILAMTGQMQDGIRTILQRLRQPAPEAPGTAGALVEDACRQWSRLYPQIALDCRIAAGAPTLANEQTHALQRLLQESLTNVARHAQASAVSVALAWNAQTVTLSITDNGLGLRADAADPRPRYGLLGMQERVRALGGTLRLERPADGGCRVEASLPLALPAGPSAPHASDPRSPSEELRA
ncbi:HAMP domain-containing sensor histidine kinase [Thauera linaloolentis]|uniref:histidine kinase n=1 Tax=Thauera linaloolentis (strain DSM 12138 / JCM 21573 / CCUG 41526 / CIP 105981 / IAM 15112 / NBRC 102519 / 47Lol) TaxID=1123367 RepID=N6Y6L0_THAL4|nr:ATP-binding protein [Thauera linaloolentis]ENO87220.1 putative two-component sensor histidine kinase [Thauera linaloolentis 47Lol = DSM 12138]MCM8567373.1 histidine kinase [Thauera linaloolentis]